MSYADEVGTRLKQWRESQDWRREDLAFKSGIPIGTVRNHETGVTTPKSEHLAAYFSVGIDPTWLVTGQESVNGHHVPVMGPINASIPSGVVSPDFTLVPRLSIEASAGNGAINGNEEVAEMLAFGTNWLSKLGISAPFARVILIRGDSMQPTLNNGDIVLVDTIVERIDDAGIYAIRVDDRLLVKRVSPRSDGSLLLISENPIYPPEEISASAVGMLGIIGRVKWCGRAI